MIIWGAVEWQRVRDEIKLVSMHFLRLGDKTVCSIPLCMSGHGLFMNVIMSVWLHYDMQGSRNENANINVMWEISLNVKALIAGISLTRWVYQLQLFIACDNKMSLFNLSTPSRYCSSAACECDVCECDVCDVCVCFNTFFPSRGGRSLWCKWKRKGMELHKSDALFHFQACEHNCCSC